MKRPNILWICTDQQRFDTLGCYGNRFVRTPNLDRVAQTGVLFDYAFCQNPVCTPSRASFLTGRYPRTTRCRQNGQSIPADEVLVTRLLRDAGYVCGLSGKLHLAPLHPDVCPGVEQRIDDGYDVFHWSPHADPFQPANEYIQWLGEKGVTFERKKRPDSRYVQTAMPAELHQTTWCAEKAIDFMTARAASDRPWLFSVNIFNPHHPFDPPADRLDRYLTHLDRIPLPNYVEGELDTKPVFQQIDHRGAYSIPDYFAPPDMDSGDHRLIRAAYWAMIDLIDEQAGRMLDVLEKTGQIENTMVVFMSDHGEMLGDHGIYMKGPHFYDAALRVPLIVAWPARVKGNRRSAALVELVDLAPTLLDAAGLERYPGMQGRSLWPLLTGETDLNTHRPDVYSEWYNSQERMSEPKKAYAAMVRTREAKLVAFHGQEPGELYDLEKDPTETRNLWDDPARLPMKAEMLKRLCDRMAETVDPLPKRTAVW
jgi:choline-sulfatase